MEKNFFSDTLTRKLKRAGTCSLTVLEAPAGYGKTTAVRMLLSGSREAVNWYTAVESMPDSSFRWFALQIGAVDEACARRLQDLGALNRSNADQAARILAELRPGEPLTLVFDNFQFALSNWQPQILDALAKMAGRGLRTVFISQNFGRLRNTLSALEDSICYIRSHDLLLSEADVRQYARQLGVQAGDATIRMIHERTDGWAAAVALYLERLGDGSVREGPEDMDDLLNGAFWQKLSTDAREALLRICLFDCVTLPMLDALVPETVLPRDALTQLLGRAPLMTYNEARKAYYPHELMNAFLRRQLKEADAGFRREVLCRSARLFREHGMDREAVACYYRAGEYEAILSCRLVCLITENIDGVPYTDLALNVLTGLDDGVLKKYPYALLRLCYALYAGCRFDAFDVQMRRVRALLDEAQPQLIGEWHLVWAFHFFPDIEAMTEQYRQAEARMDAPSQVFVREEPFLFGCASMWYLFYSKPGTMLQTADRLDAMMKLYNRLTDGHGAGAAELYRGEAYSVQGRFDESDVQAYQAAFLSEQWGNATATYGAALLLGINAIYRSDMAGLQKAVDYLENKAQGYSFLRGRALGAYMVETVRGYLLGLMMETGHSALWTQGEADSLSDLTFTNFMIKTCRVTDLLLKKEYKRAIASVEASLRMDPRLISTSTRNFMCCGLALGYLAIGRVFKAAEYLDQSLTLAGQDKNYTFLACFRKYFQVLFLLPHIAAKHAETIREIKALSIRYTRADESHIFAMLDEVPELKEELTSREREVARLAAQGLRNAEIAEALGITENTVKHHLKIAFQKMNIDRRGKLIEMLK